MDEGSSTGSNPWAGPSRPALFSRSLLAAYGVECQFINENVGRRTDWKIQESTHCFIVHLRGTINTLNVELEGCGRIGDPPAPGELWLVPAGTRYTAQASGGNIRYAEIRLDRSYDSFHRAAIRSRAAHYDAALHELTARLDVMHARTDDISRIEVEQLSDRLRDHLLNQLETRPTLQRSAPRLTRVQRRCLEEAIAENLHTHLSVAFLAAIAGMTVHDLLIAFRKEFGTTPAQYIIESRLHRTRWMLASTRYDLTRIALEAGFSSHSHFTSTFKSRVGVSPREFRNAACLS